MSIGKSLLALLLLAPLGAGAADAPAAARPGQPAAPGGAAAAPAPAKPQEGAKAAEETTPPPESAEATPPPPKPAGPPDWLRSALRVNSGELVELQVGEARVPTLFLRALGEQYGGVVLVADLDQQPGSSSATLPLLALYRHGWSVIGPALPEPPPPPMQPPRPQSAEGEQPAAAPPADGKKPEAAGTEKKPEPPKEARKEPQKPDKPKEEKPDAKGDKEKGDNGKDQKGDQPVVEAPPPSHIGPVVAGPTPEREKAFLDAAELRIRAALDHLERSGVRNVVLVGHGRGAVAALAVAVADKKRVHGLVLVGLPVVTGGDSRLDTPQLLEKLKVPTLDIYGRRDEPEVTLTAKRRREAASRALPLAPPTFGRTGAQPDAPGAGVPLFRQVAVDNAGHGFLDSQEQLERRVRGFLARHARGEERKRGGAPAAAPPAASPTP